MRPQERERGAWPHVFHVARRHALLLTAGRWRREEVSPGSAKGGRLGQMTEDFRAIGRERRACEKRGRVNERTAHVLFWPPFPACSSWNQRGPELSARLCAFSTITASR